MTENHGTASSFPTANTHAFVEENRQGISFHYTNQLRDSAIGPLAEKPHRHPFYEIIYVNSCDGRHCVQGEVFKNIHNTVFLIAQGQQHFWENVSEISGQLIYFSEAFFLSTGAGIWDPDLFRTLSGKRAIHLPARAKRVFDQLLAIMEQEYREQKNHHTMALQNLLSLLLIGFSRMTDHHDRNGDNKQLSDSYRNLLGQDMASHRSVKGAAAELGVSVSHLISQVKKQTGTSPGQLRIELLVSEGRHLIATTERSISDIARLLGYNDAAYFCRVFKKSTGVPPSVYRQQCRARQAGEKQAAAGQ